VGRVKLRKTYAETLPILDYCVSSRSLLGYEASGDLHLVKPTADGALVAVVDGAGHGEEAAITARQAILALESHPDEGVIPLMRHCHERLRKTRGAVITLVSFCERENTMTWLSVGNVEAVLMRADTSADPGREVIFMRPGVVGYRLPALQAVITPVAKNDLLIMATDGIRSDFSRDFPVEESPRKIADFILEHFLKGNDDGLVLAARYVASGAWRAGA
jgi:hypothetical protein